MLAALVLYIYMYTGQEEHFERALHLLGLSLKTGQV